MPFIQFSCFPYNYWLICPELNQRQPLTQYRCKLHSFFESKDETWFYNTFAKPRPDVQRIQNFHPPAGDLFERLPNEIIDEIFDYVLLHKDKDLNLDLYNSELLHSKAQDDALDDLISLGLSSARLWPMLLKRIHRNYQINWSGKKVGFHHYNFAFTAEQGHNYGMMDDVIEYRRGHPKIPWKIAIQSWTWEHFSCLPDMAWRLALLPSYRYRRSRPSDMKSMKYEMEIPLNDREKIERDLRRKNLRSTETEWVLRNLTTRQYVRSDRLQEPASAEPEWPTPPKSQGPLTTRMWQQRKPLVQRIKNEASQKDVSPWPFGLPNLSLTLANIFLVLTCAGERRLPSYVPEDNPQRYLNFEDAPWSGCAFEAIPLDDHLKAQEGDSESIARPDETWVDVSRDVVADIANLRFCIQKNIDISERYLAIPHTAERESERAAWNAYWTDFFASVAQTRKLHRQWVKTCPLRPWIDESMYTET